MDKGHKLTDKMLLETEQNIKRVYKKVYKDVKERYTSVLLRLETTEDGQQLFKLMKEKKKLEKILKGISKEINNANKTAVEIIKENNLNVYSLNNYYSVYDLEQSIGQVLDLPLYNRNTIKSLMDNSEDLFTQIAFDELTNINKINKALKKELASAIIQGEGMQKLAQRIKKITEKSLNDSLRIARTETTRVENIARQETFNNAEKLGIKLKKQWISTLDGRTRHSHKALFLEKTDNDGVFSNGLRYPGDPLGGAKEVCNCRCTMVSVIDETEKEKNIDKELEKQSFEVWKNEH